MAALMRMQIVSLKNPICLIINTLYPNYLRGNIPLGLMRQIKIRQWFLCMVKRLCVSLSPLSDGVIWVHCICLQLESSAAAALDWKFRRSASSSSSSFSNQDVLTAFFYSQCSPSKLPWSSQAKKKKEKKKKKETTSCHDRRCQNLSPWKQCSKVWSIDPHCDFIQSDFRESFQHTVT